MAVIVAMTEKYANDFAQWKYDGEYSFYDHNTNNVDEYMDGTHFAYLDAGGGLMGYFCFGEDARIPTVEKDVYDDGYLDIGLGLRPDLCGKKLGSSFLDEGLQFAFNSYGMTHFRLSVAAFNERAIKVYTRAGFYAEREVTNSYFLNTFIIMKCVRSLITK